MLLINIYIRNEKTITRNLRNRGKNKKCQTRQLLYPAGTRAETTSKHSHHCIRPRDICTPRRVKGIKTLIPAPPKQEVPSPAEFQAGHKICLPIIVYFPEYRNSIPDRVYPSSYGSSSSNRVIPPQSYSQTYSLPGRIFTNNKE